MSKSQEIVIVDDDEDLIKMLVFAFEAKGYSVRTFLDKSTGQQYLLRQAGYTVPALLILDRLLPDGEGLELIKLCKKQNRLNFPVLLLSMLSADKDVLEGLQLGALDYVTKPFSLPVLVQRAQALMAKA